MPPYTPRPPYTQNPQYAQPPQQPGYTDQVAQMAASLAGKGLGNYAYSNLIGGASPTGISATETALGLLPQGEAIGTLSSGAPIYSTAAPASGWGSAALSAAAPLAVAGIGAYTALKSVDGYKKGKGKGAIGGAKAGIKEAGILNAVPILGQAPALAGFISGAFGGKKHKQQYERDNARKALQQYNIIDENYNYQLPDGTFANLGSEDLIETVKDPSLKGKSLGSRSYNLDWNNPNTGKLVGAIAPIMSALTGFNKRAGQIGSALLNYGIKAGNPEAVINDLYSKAQAQGIGRNEIYGATAEAWKKGKIDAGTRDAYFAQIDKQFGVKNTSNARWDQQVGLSEKEQKRNTKELGAQDKVPAKGTISRPKDNMKR